MARGLILFVHGLGGSASGTWGDFPKYIEADSSLAGYDVAFFEYPTRLYRLPLSKKFPKIQFLAQALATTINNQFPEHRPIVLVGHSLGGLVARQYLVDQIMRDDPVKVTKLLLFAVPNDGAGLARVAQHITWQHGQLRQLCRSSDLIDLLNASWASLHVGDKIETTCVVALQDNVVAKQSAEALQGVHAVEVLADRDHRGCVKPRSADDLVFVIFRNCVLSKPPDKTLSKASSGGRRNFHVIGFDYDGTLLRGLTFSWTRVWEYLEYPKEVYEEGMRRYLQGETSYEDWCKWAVQKYRVKDLRRRNLEEIAAPLQLTKNFEKAIVRLKELEFVIGLISGGIDVFLYEKVPNADELFDHVFINTLQFDSDGVISGVEATPYDFEGKADALELMARQRGYTMDQCVFVGEGFNDGEVTKRAGLSIAYPPRDFQAAASADIRIEENDLMKVVEAVIR